MSETRTYVSSLGSDDPQGQESLLSIGSAGQDGLPPHVGAGLPAITRRLEAFLTSAQACLEPPSKRESYSHSCRTGCDCKRRKPNYTYKVVSSTRSCRRRRSHIGRRWSICCPVGSPDVSPRLYQVEAPMARDVCKGSKSRRGGMAAKV